MMAYTFQKYSENFAFFFSVYKQKLMAQEFKN